jgi:hypothetical protein
MSLLVFFWGGVSTYNSMYVLHDCSRLNNSLLTRFMRTHVFFVANAVILSRVSRGQSLVDVLIRDSSDQVIAKKKFFLHFPFSLVQ